MSHHIFSESLLLAINPSSHCRTGPVFGVQDPVPNPKIRFLSGVANGTLSSLSGSWSVYVKRSTMGDILKISVPAEPSRRIKTIVAIALFILSCGYNLLRYEMEDTAILGGDVSYYQSIAVNLVSGDGYRFGAINDFSSYKYGLTPYDGSWERMNNLKASILETDRADFYGSPGYPLFLAGIYSVVGIHPIAAKIVNVFLVAMVAVLLPFMSAQVWRRHGFSTGVLVSLFFIFKTAPNPSHLLGEPLVLFLLATWGMLFTSCGKHASMPRIIALGVLTAVLILVKSYALLVILAALYFAIKIRPRRTGMAMAALYLAVVAGLILPWSIFATRHSDRTVVISTQFDNLIMDGNNEDVIRGGGFSPWWHDGDPKYLYNRLADTDMTTLEKVGQFYRENWTRLPQMFANKLYSATGRKVHVFLIVIMFVAVHVVGRRRNRRLRRSGQEGDVHLPVFPLFCFVIWLTNTLVGFGLLRYTHIFLPFMLITAAYGPLVFRRIRQERRESLVTDE